MPIPEGTRPLVPRFLVEWERERAEAEERRRQRERRQALRAALEGRDYPYSYPGAPFPFSAVAVTA
ncbi:hypothetical protein ACFY2W_19215 [Streptomyces sp. NPDC001262]|uniref:hypothetical protein n=1 Tax=Streptomyces sp. NPDC001262 TaxID=3364552 RepID=UPI00367A7366